LWDVSSVANIDSMFCNAFAFKSGILVCGMCQVLHKNAKICLRMHHHLIWILAHGMYLKLLIQTKCFLQAQDFDQDLGSWDVSDVIDMKVNVPMGRFIGPRCEFVGCIKCGRYEPNVPKSRNLQVKILDCGMFPKVTDMTSMFSNAHSFNRRMRDWNVSSVTNMSRMFERAYCFNGVVGAWITSPFTGTSRMFCHATSFNHDNGAWD
jgi:Mycoplasma protein of unknown function, DUF285